jgi:hypothetical protein
MRNLAGRPGVPLALCGRIGCYRRQPAHPRRAISTCERWPRSARILGDQVGSTAPVFLAFLAAHVLAGLTAVMLIPVNPAA